MKLKRKEYSIIGMMIILICTIGWLFVNREKYIMDKSVENKQSNNSLEQYAVNKNGKTYGPNRPELGYEPDLIWTYGDDGTLGYVRAEDLDSPDFKTPDEATAWEHSKDKSTVLPLYDKDEENIIGSFTMGR